MKDILHTTAILSPLPFALLSQMPDHKVYEQFLDFFRFCDRQAFFPPHFHWLTFHVTRAPGSVTLHMIRGPKEVAQFIFTADPTNATRSQLDCHFFSKPPRSRSLLVS